MTHITLVVITIDNIIVAWPIRDWMTSMHSRALDLATINIYPY